jgi:hypothetical protein
MFYRLPIVERLLNSQSGQMDIHIKQNHREAVDFSNQTYEYSKSTEIRATNCSKSFAKKAIDRVL